MKLKTLNEFDPEPCCHAINHRELREEAIKWVKERMITSLIGDYTAKKYFMEFFNITEEDLK